MTEKFSKTSTTQENQQKKIVSIFIVNNNSILIESMQKIYLINFQNCKFTILYNKKNPLDLNIIYTFDENVRQDLKNSVRSYIFCKNEENDLLYFYLEDNYLNQKSEKIILHKIPSAGNGIIDMAIICFNQEEKEKENKDKGKYFLFIFLTKNNLKFFVTRKTNKDLGYIINYLYENPSQDFTTYKNFYEKYLIDREKYDINENEKDPFSLSIHSNLNYFEYNIKNTDVKKLFLCEEYNQIYIILLGEFNILIVEIMNNESLWDLYRKIRNMDIYDAEYKEDIRFSMRNEGNKNYNNITNNEGDNSYSYGNYKNSEENLNRSQNNFSNYSKDNNIGGGRY